MPRTFLRLFRSFRRGTAVGTGPLQPPLWAAALEAGEREASVQCCVPRGAAAAAGRERPRNSGRASDGGGGREGDEKRGGQFVTGSGTRFRPGDYGAPAGPLAQIKGLTVWTRAPTLRPGLSAPGNLSFAAADAGDEGVCRRAARTPCLGLGRGKLFLAHSRAACRSLETRLRGDAWAVPYYVYTVLGIGYPRRERS